MVIMTMTSYVYCYCNFVVRAMKERAGPNRINNFSEIGRSSSQLSSVSSTKKLSDINEMFRSKELND